MFVLIVLDKIERHYVTLGCGALTLIGVFGIIMRSPKAIMSTLNIRSIFTTSFWYQSGAAGEAVTGINWSTIIFIAGMMIMVEVMADAGFFRWLCMLLAKALSYKSIIYNIHDYVFLPGYVYRQHNSYIILSSCIYRAGKDAKV